METTTKKITLSTVKSFIKKNEGKLFVNIKSDFSGMTDCIEQCHEGFKPATKITHDPESSNIDHHLGIAEAWFVGCSRDYFRPYQDETYEGIQVSNSCGSWILAIKK